ncbi:EAL domain-containing protein [Chthonobacter albigriseus]|uniref:EAL domain-containing protein n=1 Tax=Chthonobacter albigriseus TaxID=1683161 RepID=UPI0015EEF4BD|nr:EAL domain-containing protein [Chthonobacter albigriseus]
MSLQHQAEGDGRRRKAVRDGSLIAVIGLVLAFLHGVGVFAPLSRVLQDQRFHATTRAPSDKVVLVDIDARSLAGIGVWPWDRRIYADLLASAATHGAEAVAFDIDFSTRSTTGSDAAFAEALAGSGVPVYMAAFVQPETAAGPDRLLLSLPTPALMESAWPALVNVPVDPDGAVRSILYGLDTPEGPVQSMPALLAGSERTTGAFSIDYSIDAAGLRRVSFVDVLRGTVPPDTLKGRVLIVGATAVELRDIFQVPRHGLVSGSTILALATETVAQDRAVDVGGGYALALLAGAVVLAILAFALISSWTVMPLLAGAGVALHGAAVGLHTFTAQTLDTGPALAAVAVFSLWGLLRELDLRQWLLRLARTRIANADRILVNLIEEGFDGILVVDSDGRIRHANRSATAILGLGDQALPRTIADLPDPVARLVSRPGAHDGVEPSSGLLRMGEGSEARILEYATRPVRLDPESGPGPTEEPRLLVCLSFRDVTERQRAAEQMEYLAYHDALTGLPNRRALEARLADSPAEMPAALLFFDLDRFKDVNGKLGHGWGDALLRDVATRATCAIGPDAFLARLGGDEFAALLPSGSASDPANRTMALLKDLSRPFSLQNHKIAITASAGLRLLDGSQTTPQDTLRQADLALGEAKKAGRNRAVIFSPDLEVARLRRLRLEHDLEAAFRNNELRLVFQPQVSLATGEIVGAEALTRWYHPERGFVSPAEFIPVMEETGLIHRLGAWTLATACREAARWPEHIRIAVNVSAIELEMGDVPATVADILSATGLRPDRLELEITETAFVKETPLLVERLRRIRGFGVGFALDDFGTGYSSLGYLHRFPVGKIKIDRSFVMGLPEDETAAAIVRSIVALAASLRLRTVAEGIETERQQDCLRRMGCTEGQGYLFSQPVDSATIAALIARDAARPSALAG